MGYEVVVKGFNTEDEAKAFMHWYEGSGEQEIPYWLEEADNVETDYMNVDMSKYDDSPIGKTFILPLKMQ